MTRRVQLTAVFDVTDLTDEERAALSLSVMFQHEAGDDYPTVPVPDMWTEDIEVEESNSLTGEENDR